MGIFSFLTGSGQKEKINDFLSRGAIIIDVRSAAEFNQGHPAGAKNIPLNKLEAEINKIKKLKKPVLVCCASGARSGIAKNILQKHEIDCYNAGSWYSLN
ncbi:MAG: rhodanese-like domain-containing protein [Candidatus Cyclobacteriaceae bacterium M2_1C_046]